MGFYYLFLKIMPKWTKLVKAKITSFRTFDASSSSSYISSDVRQFLFPQLSQVTMFVNLGL